MAILMPIVVWHAVGQRTLQHIHNFMPCIKLHHVHARMIFWDQNCIMLLQACSGLHVQRCVPICT